MFWSLVEITVDRHLNFFCAGPVLSAFCTLSHYFINNSIIDFTNNVKHVSVLTSMFYLYIYLRIDIHIKDRVLCQ